MTVPTSRAVRILGSVLGLSILAGCGIGEDTGPRDIPPEARGDLSESGSAGDDQPVGGRRIFLVVAEGGPGGRDLLRSVPRDVSSSPISVMSSLLAGPNASEQAARMRTAIPPGTTLLGAEFVSQGTLLVDISNDIFDATGDTLIDAVAQVVYTANEIDGVEQVELSVDGQSQRWPRGDGTLANGPLTIYDYPGRMFSTEPDFPSVPSP